MTFQVSPVLPSTSLLSGSNQSSPALSCLDYCGSLLASSLYPCSIRQAERTYWNINAITSRPSLKPSNVSAPLVPLPDPQVNPVPVGILFPMVCLHFLSGQASAQISSDSSETLSGCSPSVTLPSPYLASFFFIALIAADIIYVLVYMCISSLPN